jgi:Ca2+/Na+ antiporter
MQVATETAVSVAPALHCEREISIGNVIGDNIIMITLVFGLVALIRSPQVFLSEILSTLRASHRKNMRSATLILATYPLFFSAHVCS